MSKRLFIFVLLLILGSVGVTYVGGLDGRINHLERDDTVSPARFERLVHELSLVREDLERSETLLRSYEGDDRELGERLGQIESEVATTRSEISRRSGDLLALEQRQSRELEEALGSRLADFDQHLDSRWADVNRTLEATVRLAKDSQETVHSLARNLPAEPDRSKMWGELMGPVVQLADESTVGSGVLLRSIPDETGGEEWRTYLLTAWHVVRDILDDPTDLTQPIPVNVYRPDGGITPERAVLLEHDASVDIAILLMQTTESFPGGAKLPARARLRGVRTFDPVYAVGCPLGNDPIPTHGEVVDTHHEVDGDLYWMISAPTYIGNSGGGIFDAESRELLGIFSKIYTHGNLRPTVVPHMGLVTPMEVIYDWLTEVGYDELVEG
jgi:S1-C subfamily serine protease